MRALPVLILVLGALAVLVVGVLRLRGDLPAQPVGQAPAASAAAPPTKPAPLEPASEAVQIRAKEAGKVDESNPRSSASASDWVNANELDGTVLNPQGQPLSGTQVSLSTAYDLIFAGNPIDTSQDQTVRTDDNGRFAFRNIEPRSRYKLTIKHKDYTLKEMFSVAVGETGVAEEPPITLVPGATLQGHVLDAAGNSVDGATLVLDNLMNDGMSFELPDRMTATSDRSGAYIFSNVPKGQRILTVSAPGYATITLNGFTFTADEHLPPSDIKLDVAEIIRGRVLCAGQGIPGANVQAIGIGGSATQVSRVSTTTDAAGQFIFETLRSGTEYNLIASAKGYRFENANRSKTGTNNVVIEAFKKADVCGRVIDAATGAAVSSFTCRMRLLNGPGMPTSQTEITQTFDSPNGEFCVNGVPDGEFVIEASASGYAPSFSDTVKVTRGQAPGGSMVKLTRGGSLSGRVIDAAGNPVCGARITTHDKEWADNTFSQMLGDEMPSIATKVDVRCDVDGRFLLMGLTPDAYQMHIRAAGFSRFMRNDILVVDGQETKLGDIQLSRGGSLRGTLFDPSGKPLVGGMITVSPEDNRPSIGYSARTGENGRFQIAHVQPGQYVVTAIRGVASEGNPIEQLVGQQKTQKHVTITDDNAQVVDLTLSP